MPKQTRQPADPSTGDVAKFGYDVRQLRQQAGKTYTAIAAQTFYSKSAIHAVDQGHTLPSVSLLRAFVTECGGDPDEWQLRRDTIAAQLAAAKGSLPKTNPREQHLPPPDPSTASTAADYNDALKRLREWSGMTYRQIEEITQHYPRRVAPSTLCAAFTRGTLPARDLVESFLRAIELDDEQQRGWLTAWQAIQDGHPVWLLRLWLTHPDTDHAVDTAADRHTQQQDAPDEQETPPIMSYNPAVEVRDWTFENGRWRAIRERTMPWRARLARCELSHTQRIAARFLLITLMIIATVLFLTLHP
jgi:transcriptional regulator with XRE-family HTH domain